MPFEKDIDQEWIHLLPYLWRGAVGARVIRTTTQSIPAGAATPLSFNSAIWNVPATVWVIGTPTRLTAPYSGYYRMGGGWSRAAAANPNASVHRVYLRANGANYLVIQDVHTLAGNMVVVSCSVDGVYLSAGQYVEVLAYHSDPNPQNSSAATATTPYNCFGWIRGPL